MKHTKVGIRLRSDRKAYPMTLRELEAKSGIPIATISNIENGKQKNPGVETIKKLAKALKCDASWLAFGE